MKRLATVLSVAAAIMFLSDCSNTIYGYRDYDDSYDRNASDNAYNRYACRSYNYDPRFCR